VTWRVTFETLHPPAVQTYEMPGTRCLAKRRAAHRLAADVATGAVPAGEWQLTCVERVA
jgi:hypothetical protein